jgi:hypothetical protein
MMALKTRTFIDRSPPCAIAIVVPLAELIAAPANMVAKSRLVIFIAIAPYGGCRLYSRRAGRRLYISVTYREKSCFPSRQ